MSRRIKYYTDVDLEVEDRLTSSQIVDDSMMIVPSSQEEEITMPPSSRQVQRSAMHPCSDTGDVVDAITREAPVHRANTIRTSDRLGLLRHARDGIAAGGSQLPADAVQEAEGMLHEIHQVLERARAKHAGPSKTVQRR